MLCCLRDRVVLPRLQAIGFNLILILLYVLPDESDASELSTLLITSTPLHQGVIARSKVLVTYSFSFFVDTSWFQEVDDCDVALK